MTRALLRALAWALAFACLAVVALPGDAGAHAAHGRPASIDLGPKRASVPRVGPRGKVEVDTGTVRLLRGEGAQYVGTFQLKNAGPGPLVIYRVGLAPREGWPDAPGGLGVTALERESALAPGASRTYQVSWRADATRAEQLFAHVVIESDAAAADAKDFDPPVFVGVVADRRVGPARHLLSLLVGLPLSLALLALVSRLVPAFGPRPLRLAALGVSLAHAAFAVWANARFLRGFARADGNEGLQLVERFVGFGRELHLGLDGFAVSLVPLVSVGLVAALAARSAVAPGFGRFVAGAGSLVSAASLGLVSQSLELSVLAHVVAALGAALTIDAGAPRAVSLRVLAVAGVAAIAMAAFGHAFAHHAEPYLLLDGHMSGLASSIPELVREGLHAHEGESVWFGLPLARLGWVLGALASLPLLGLVGFHGAQLAAADEGDPSGAALVLGALGALGGHTLLRFGLLVLPSGAAWAAPGLSALGLATMLLAGLAALVERDPRRLVARLACAMAGAFVVTLCSRTPQGTQGALAWLVALVGVAPLALLLAGALARRVGRGPAAWGGVGATAPRLAVAWVVAVLGLGALPGGAAAWGAWLGAGGALLRSPLTGVLFGLACAVTVVAQLRALSFAVGAPGSAWSTASRLEPHGGRVPDLFRAEWAPTGLLVLVALVLGLAPWVALGASDAGVLDSVPALDPPGPSQLG